MDMSPCGHDSSCICFTSSLVAFLMFGRFFSICVCFLRVSHIDPDVMASVACLAEVKKKDLEGAANRTVALSSCFDVVGVIGFCCRRNSGPLNHIDACSCSTLRGRVPISAGFSVVGIYCHCEGDEILRIVLMREVMYLLLASLVLLIHAKTSRLSVKYFVG